ncbi:terminase [Entomomonas moraniae]|uniref:Terminase n=2 Tax=Entomomonas moraniae TaxID=2213226 RepID=A0A3S9XDB6_9GAMM|nr:terminase [Entomomonas moraniae]
MTKEQAEFFQLQAKYSLFVGGYGSGKTETLANCALRDALSSSQAIIACYEPTYDLIRLILAPRMEEKLLDFGIRYKYNKTENIIYTSNPQCGDFILRTLENPVRIVGYESYRAHVDEIDTLKKDQANAVWQKIIARNRQSLVDDIGTRLEGSFNRVSAYTTPEGFKFAYDTWVKNKKAGYELVRAKTASNPFLPEDYVQSLLDSYPSQLIKAYLDGEFVNLNSGNVYPSFDRKLNHSNAIITKGDTLYVGMDFNRLKMSAVVYVIKDNDPIAVKEHTGVRDTPDMAKLLCDLYKNNGHSVIIYPDASGANSSSKNASESDLSILRQAGLTVRVNSTNPAIMNRINAFNAMILNGEGVRNLKVNTNNCPELTEALEQQPYDKNGMPDKSGGLDHVLDAAGYFIAYQYPIVKRQFTTQTIPGFGY